MTAAGRKTAASLTPADRIMVTRESDRTAELFDRAPELAPARRLTGDDVITVRVIEVRKAPNAPYRRTTEIVTSAGSIFTVGHQTFPLAPETPAAIKRAHVEALAENVERNRNVTPARRAAAEAETRTAAEAQTLAWLVRHESMGTNVGRYAYATIAYREADHAEALADDEARERAAFLPLLSVADQPGQVHDWLARHNLSTDVATAGTVLAAYAADHAEALTEAQQRQTAAWLARHADLGTDDGTRGGTLRVGLSVAYRRADHAEALALHAENPLTDAEADTVAFGWSGRP